MGEKTLSIYSGYLNKAGVLIDSTSKGIQE